MMKKPRPPFGLKNAPPAVLHAPGGLPNAAPPTPRRKMSMTVGLVSLGATALAGGAWYESRHAREQAEACRAQAAQRGLPPDDCPSGRSSSGSHGGGSHGWFSSSGSSSSPSTSAQHLGASPAGHGAFGGFGHAGAAHGAGS